MNSGSTFPQRLTKIDDLTRPDHTYLTQADRCYFLGEIMPVYGLVPRPTPPIESDDDL